MQDENVIGLEELETLEDQEPGRRDSRSRIVALVILLLLLLLCVVTTAAETWLERAPMRTEAIVKNVGCLVCHTELIPDFARPAVHEPFAVKTCTSCHTPHGTQKETRFFSGGTRTWRQFVTALEWLPLKWIFDAYQGVAGVIDGTKGGKLVKTQTANEKGETSELILPETELCWMCHGNLGPQLQMAYEHAPFEKGYCTNCHDPHASDFRVLLVQDERDLCVTCHPIGPELAREQVHPPFGGRYCTNCHHPHASDYKGVLVDNQRDLCFACHPSVATLSLKAVQHQPFLYDNCTGCHEPHGADARPLLVEEQPPLCYNCHPGIREDFKKPSHHPVGLKLGCPDCHNPHAADYRGLIVAKDNELCYRCHATAIQARYEGSEHKNRLCIDCHTPHGSRWSPILVDSNPEVCLRCHPTLERTNNHPVRPVRRPRYSSGVPIATIDSGKVLNCTTTCHDPHGTQYRSMVTWNHPRDGGCLGCHPSVGKYF